MRKESVDYNEAIVAPHRITMTMLTNNTISLVGHFGILFKNKLSYIATANLSLPI